MQNLQQPFFLAPVFRKGQKMRKRDRYEEELDFENRRERRKKCGDAGEGATL